MGDGVIMHLLLSRETLQRQYDEQERQILDLIARVDAELSQGVQGEPGAVAAAKSAIDRKRSSSKPNGNFYLFIYLFIIYLFIYLFVYLFTF